MKVVIKFGGSSISKHGFDKIINIVKTYEYENMVIVLSALKGTTDNLLNFIRTYDKSYIDKIRIDHTHLLNELDIKTISKKINNLFTDLDNLSNSIILDKTNIIQQNEILTFGELLSTNVFNEYQSLFKLGYELVDSSKFIKSNNSSIELQNLYFMKGTFYCNDHIFELLQNKVLICQGFICSTNDNYKCTLSRGGSDTTASLIASKIIANRLEIWTDVDGIYNSNPSIVSGAKIIKNIDYELSQELSAMGAKVIHPYCINPCKEKNIPIYIKNTYGSNTENTIINSEYSNEYALMIDRDINVFEITSVDMWNDYGFVSNIFQSFNENGIDINIITTSQFSVMATTNEINQNKILKCMESLRKCYEVKIYRKCDIISVVGKNILQFEKLNKVFDIVKNSNNLLLNHFSSNNKCISFVIENSDSLKVYKELFSKIFFINENIDVTEKWWYTNRNNILHKMKYNNNLYLYNLNTIKNKCMTINTLYSVDKKFYAMKANSNKDVLLEVSNHNFGFECVSIQEVSYIRSLIPNSDILFTPNYCNINEYKYVLSLQNSYVTIDNKEILENYTDSFQNREIILRLDMNMGDGHNKRVITEGSRSKFGISLNQLDEVVQFCRENSIKVIGFHSHRGSNINDINNWINVLKKIKKIAINYDINIINIGGGFGTMLNHEDFIKLDEAINENKGDLEIWIEPGRFIVSEAGVLLSKVNLVRCKENINFIGLDTGMNSLIRPTLYDAYHNIHNLTKIDNENNECYDIVGPICESGDILGLNRLLPKTNINDIILIEDAGAYGFTMSNKYNMREPAIEKIFNNITEDEMVIKL